MRKSFGMKIGALAVSAVVLTACGSNSSGGSGGSSSSGGGSKEGVTATSVEIGTISDSTGPTTAIMLPWLHGMQSVVKQVNADGGVAGRKINLVSEDDKFDVAVGLPLFKKLVSQTPVVAIAGVNTGDLQAAVAPLVERSGVPVLTGEATSKTAVVPFKKHFFGLAPTYADQADVIIDYGKKRTKKSNPRVAAVQNGTSSGAEFQSLIQERAKKQGFTYAGGVTLPATSTTADAQVQKLVAMKPDFVALLGSSAGVNLIGKSQQKLGSKIPLIGVSASGGPASFTGLPPAVGNLYEYVQAFSPSAIQETGTADMVAAAKASGYDAETQDANFVSGYVSGKVLVAALEKAGKDLSRDSLTTALESLKDVDTGGLSPKVSYAADSRTGIETARPLKYDYAKKQFVAVGQFDDYAGAVTHEYSGGK